MRDLDDDDLRSLSGIVMGGLLALLPLLVGRQDVSTTLLVRAAGAVAILPVWRHAGEPIAKPVAAIPLLELISGRW